LGWEGTKNKRSHRVWLPRVVQDLIADLNPEATTGFVFHELAGQVAEDDRAVAGH